MPLKRLHAWPVPQVFPAFDALAVFHASDAGKGSRAVPAVRETDGSRTLISSISDLQNQQVTEPK
jgi:hypothetical protein